MYTVDASVWVNGFDQREAGHATSRQLLEVLRARALPIIVPNLVLAEVAGAISRTRNDPLWAETFAETLGRGMSADRLDGCGRFNWYSARSESMAVPARPGAATALGDRRAYATPCARSPTRILPAGWAASDGLGGVAHDRSR